MLFFLHTSYMDVKYGANTPTFLIGGYLNCKIEPYESFHLPTFVQTALLYTTILTSSLSVIISLSKIVYSFMIQLKRYPQFVSMIILYLRKIFITSILKALVLVVSTLTKTTLSGMASILLLIHAFHSGTFSPRRSTVISLLFHALN